MIYRLLLFLDIYTVRCFELERTFPETAFDVSDEMLIERFRNGDEAAFEQIAGRYLGLISTLSSRYRPSSPELETADFVQEGMLGLLSACKRYEADRDISFKNYLMLIVENRFKSIARSNHKQRAVPVRNMVSIDDEAESAFDLTELSPDEILETKEYVAHLHRILKGRLSDLEYKVAILHLSGYSYKECAERLSVPLKTVDNAQTRIRKKLSR